MSQPAIQYVLDTTQHTGAKRLVMVILAHHMHPDGTGAFPSVATLMREARLSRRTVQRLITTLAADGVLSVEFAGRGRSIPNRYAFPLMRQQYAEFRTLNASKRRQVGVIHDTSSHNPGVKRAINPLTQEPINVNSTFHAQNESISATPPPPTDPREKQLARYARCRSVYPPRTDKAGAPLCPLKHCTEPPAQGEHAWFCVHHGDPGHNYAILRAH